MPALNFDGQIVCFWLVLSLPILLGMIATLLAASDGANSCIHLTRTRSALATALAGVNGLFVLGGALFLTALATQALGGAALLGGALLSVFLVSLLGVLAAYHTARILSLNLNRYRCRTCGARFRSRYPTDRCEACERQAEQAESASALAGLAARARELQGRDHRGGEAK